MVEEKEPKGITRRQFLKGITALGASALLSSCGVKEEPVSQKPTETLRPAETTPPTKVPTQESSPTPQSTLTPESTPTPEITRIVGLTITADYLKNAFAGIGGEEVITNGQEEVSVVQFGQEYVSQSWGEEIDFTKLAEDPVASLKYLISLGAYRGEEGIFTPGKQGEEVIFPQLIDLSLARLTLENVPSEAVQRASEYQEWVSPRKLLLRPETQMAIIGLLHEPQLKEEITIDQEGALNYALVAFTDYLRASEEGIPRHYLAIIPDHLPADPENKNILSLKNLLEANGYQYDSQNKEIAVVGQDKQKTVLVLNQIEGEELTKDLRKATGLAFVDQMKGELIKSPLVPYYEEMPAVWEIKEETDEDGTITLLLQGQDEKGEMVAVAKASYDQEEEAWGWEKVEPTLEPGEVLIGQDFIGLPEEKILELLSLPENKDKMILPVYPDPETQIRVEPYRDRKGERHMVLIYNSQERVLFNPTNFGVRFEMIIQESRGEMLSSGSFYLKNGFIIAVDNNVPGVEFKMSPGEESEEGLGTILATNIQERQGVRPELGKPLITIFCNLDSVGDNPRDYLLEYKGRIVSLKKNE